MSALSGSAAPPPEVRPGYAEPNLGILTEVPLPARLSSGFSKLIRLYSRASTVIGTLIGLAAIWFLSAPARDTITSWWLDAVLLLVLLVAASLIGRLRSLSQGLTMRYVLGPPAWGDAGGMEARLLRGTFRAASDVQLDFNDTDQKAMNRLAAFDARITPIQLRHTLIEARTSEGAGEAVTDEQWKETWNRIQNEPVEGTTYAAVRRDYPNALLTIPFWLLNSLSATITLDFFMLAVVWLGYRWATGIGSILPIIEVIILFSFIVPTWLFINRVYRTSTMPMMSPPRELLAESGLDDSLLAEADEARGTSVRPLAVRLGPKYMKEQLAFSIRAFAVDSSSRIFGVLAVAGVALVGGILFGSGSVTALAETYLKLVLVIVIAPVGLLIGYYLASILLQDVRKTLAPVVSGFVGAAVPLLGQYVLTGSIGSNPHAIAISVALGAVGIIGASLAEFVKMRFETKPKASRSN